MANINWDSQELESTAAQVNTLLQNYDKTMDEIQLLLCKKIEKTLILK